MQPIEWSKYSVGIGPWQNLTPPSFAGLRCEPNQTEMFDVFRELSITEGLPRVHKVIEAFVAAEAREAIRVGTDLKADRGFMTPLLEVRCTSPAPYSLGANAESTIQSFIERLHPRYHDLVQSLAGRIAPMDASCRVSVCIPVAAHNEPGFIGRAIESFARLHGSEKQAELVLLLNAPSYQVSNREAQITGTLRAIEAVTCRVDVPVHVLAVEPPGLPFSGMGFLRAVVSDVAVVRHAARNAGADHVLVRADADTRGVDRHYVRYLVDGLLSGSSVGAMSGRLEWSPENCVRDPIIWISHVMDRIISRSWHVRQNSAPSGGANHAVRASWYAAVNGYNEASFFGEDCDFGVRLNKLVQSNPELAAVRRGGKMSTLWSSTRRGVAAIRADRSASQQWRCDETSFGEDDGVRSLVDGECNLPWAHLTTLEEIVPAVEREINRTLAGSGVDLRNEQHAVVRDIRRILTRYFCLTFDVSATDGSISIKDGSRLMTRWGDYSQRALDRWKAQLPDSLP